jgi:hypothetical protein
MSVPGSSGAPMVLVNACPDRDINGNNRGDFADVV